MSDKIVYFKVGDKIRLKPEYANRWNYPWSYYQGINLVCLYGKETVVFNQGNKSGEAFHLSATDNYFELAVPQFEYEYV
jgi:hypothetical protein